MACAHRRPDARALAHAGRRQLLLSGFATLAAAAAPPAVRAQPAGADDPAAAAWSALRQPNAIALMRHADAPGVGDPAGWRLDDCATQRNLSERGRAQARAVGARLRAERIRIARLLSSPWCRCLDTARLLDAGAVQLQATFGNAFVMSDQRDTLAAGARVLLRQWQGPGVLLVVTHGENIQALAGHSPASAEIVVVLTDAAAESGLRTIGSLPPPER